MNNYTKLTEGDKFFASKNGQDAYDEELNRIQENRRRIVFWQKEQLKAKRKRPDYEE